MLNTLVQRLTLTSKLQIIICISDEMVMMRVSFRIGYMHFI